MLNDIFEPFGRIVSCRVQRDGVGSSKGIGTIIVGLSLHLLFKNKIKTK